LAVTDNSHAAPDVVICGPDSIGEHPGADHVLACSLLPFAVRFRDPLPDHVLDFGLLWPGQSDVFIGATPPSPDTVAWLSAERPRTQADLLEEAATTSHDAGVRLLTDVHPAARSGVPVFLAPIVHGGSVVLLRDPNEATWPARRKDERATVELRVADQPPSR
jgi:uncharacterized protein (TIGR03089 family)